MSTVQLAMIWQPEKVLPYILHELKRTVEKISPVHKIYLYGSRAKTPITDWNTLDGKDWDIIMVCNFPIINTHIWTTARNYHVDLSIISKQQADELLKHNKYLVELFPSDEFIRHFNNHENDSLKTENYD
ncbi:hypothetical protein [Kordia jejudonensis]|uniref:hypothetical protein n=1 Tax=Kordia jejudonensis TaxID=1348245 RepID=UPI0006298A38|nr:hypothetical protein [Kordia jejudonensis]